MRQLVVRGCAEEGGFGWGGGWSSLSPVGSGDGVFLGGRGRGDSRWCVSAGVGGGGGRWGSSRGTSVAWSWGGGGDGMLLAWYCCWGGAWGWVLCLTGVWASCQALWVLRVLAVRFLRSLACRDVEVRLGAGCLGISVGLWSIGSGWLLVDGACWHGLRVRGLLVVVGCSL